jgi:glycerol kinase
VKETTALGAAYLAGLAEGVWASTDEVRDNWRLEAEFQPSVGAGLADTNYTQWRRAVERARGWVASS